MLLYLFAIWLMTTSPTPSEALGAYHVCSAAEVPRYDDHDYIVNLSPCAFV